MLSSPKNPTIQHIRKLQAQARYRRETGLFVIEGERLAGECLAAGLCPETLLYTGPGHDALLDQFRALGADPIPVSQAAMRAASDTETPQGLLAAVPIPAISWPDEPDFLLILDGLRDPGNLGAILRTAAAAVDGVLLTPGSADPFQPKVVRAGMGAHFKLPLRVADWPEIETQLAGMPAFLADAAASLAYTAADLSGPLALVIGGEAHGAGAGAAALHPTGLRIPMPGGMESLNAAVAAGILIYEVLRQRGARW